MAEYIERGALDKALTIAAANGKDKDRRTWAKAICVLHDAPAADVAPVVHGHWIIGVDNDDFGVKCSKCEWTDIFEVAGIFAVERIAKAMHYCPNCGAKMDEDI